MNTRLQYKGGSRVSYVCVHTVMTKVWCKRGVACICQRLLLVLKVESINKTSLISSADTAVSFTKTNKFLFIIVCHL